jgi:hypothetical protein
MDLKGRTLHFSDLTIDLDPGTAQLQGNLELSKEMPFDVKLTLKGEDFARVMDRIQFSRDRVLLHGEPHSRGRRGRDLHAGDKSLESSCAVSGSIHRRSGSRDPFGRRSRPSRVVLPASGGRRSRGVGMVLEGLPRTSHR